MSATFYELLKYAKTGIASPEMTHYDKLKALAMCKGGFPVSTLTGIPPISFKSDGTPLTAWSISGAMTQTGTPTPSAPIQPEECGDRTANLIPKIVQGGVNANNGNLSTSTTRVRTEYVSVESGQTCTISGGDLLISSAAYYLNGEFVSSAIQSSSYTKTLTIPSGVNQIAIGFRNLAGTDILPENATSIMMNEGETAKPYEPYGYAIPISCAGQTVPVYLGQVSTVRRIKKLVLTGNETIGAGSSTVYYATGGTPIECQKYSVVASSHYKYHSGGTSSAPENSVYTNAGAGTAFWFKTEYGNDTTAFKAYLAQQYQNGTPVTIWYVLATPTTAIVNEPLCKIGDYADELHSTDAAVTIPTAKGQNTLSVGTTLQPSEVSITGGIK